MSIIRMHVRQIEAAAVAAEAHLDAGWVGRCALCARAHVLDLCAPADRMWNGLESDDDALRSRFVEGEKDRRPMPMRDIRRLADALLTAREVERIRLCGRSTGHVSPSVCKHAQDRSCNCVILCLAASTWHLENNRCSTVCPMSLQPSRTHRFFPATGPEGDRHLIIECAGSDISELELEASYQL